MALKAHNFVGLAKPVYLPDDIAVEIAIVPASITNVRSNQKRGAAEVTTYTQHETANFNAGADADMHKRWLHSGAGGGYVGFNFVVDDTKIIQLTPLDEVTWAAGTPSGNRTSDHCELCVNSDIDHTKARRNAAALAAGVLKARGLQPSQLVQHNMWTGKNCPMLMRANNNAVWNGSFYPLVKTLYAVAEEPAPVKTRTFTLRFETPIRTTPGFWDTANNKGNVIKNMPAGTKGEVISGPVLVDGVAFYDLRIPGFGTGFVQDQVLHTLDINEGS